MENLIKATNKAYAAYKAENPCTSEFMETDFKAGFRRGFVAAESSNDLRKRAAIAAMQGILASLDHPYDSDFDIKEIAHLAVRQAEALVNELNKPKQS